MSKAPVSRAPYVFRLASAAFCAMIASGPADALTCKRPLPSTTLDRVVTDRSVTALARWTPDGMPGKDLERARRNWQAFSRFLGGEKALSEPPPAVFDITGSADIMAITDRGEARGPKGWEGASLETITVEQQCIKPWCPAFPEALVSPKAAGETWIIARRQGVAGDTDPVWTVTPSACGGEVFADPGAEEREDVERWLHHAGKSQAE